MTAELILQGVDPISRANSTGSLGGGGVLCRQQIQHDGRDDPASVFVDLWFELMYFESLSSFAGCVMGLSGKDAYILEAEAVVSDLDIVQHRRLLI